MAGQADSHGSAVISLDSSSQQLLSLLRISSSTERERERGREGGRKKRGKNEEKGRGKEQEERKV